MNLKAQLLTHDVTINIVVGRNLSDEEKCVSYYEPSNQLWYAERDEKNLRVARTRRIDALTQVLKQERRTDRPGRPREDNKIVWQAKLRSPVKKKLEYLSQIAGMHQADYVALLILKVFAAHRKRELLLSGTPPEDIEGKDWALAQKGLLIASGELEDDRYLEWIEEEQFQDSQMI